MKEHIIGSAIGVSLAFPFCFFLGHLAGRSFEQALTSAVIGSIFGFVGTVVIMELRKKL